MLALPKWLTFLLTALCTAKRFTPRAADEGLSYLASRDTNITINTIKPDADGRIPLFEYETATLTPEEAQNILSALQQHNASQYANNFVFASIDVTSYVTAIVTLNHTLPGPGNCRIFPGDDAWPCLGEWESLSIATDGHLLHPIPRAHVCYANRTGHVDNATCQTLTEGWTDPYFQVSLDDPIEVLSPLYEGSTCQPPALLDSSSCTQGGYPVYVVNATIVAHIQLAVNFARNTGVRLVVKNTGHDFSRKSAGAGSLSIWTHHSKEIAYIPEFSDGDYTGPAIKAGAGVQGFELYAAARDFGVIALGGECPTVGIMGGWIQGGGHSPVSPLFGMGADQALGFEVVTADGRFVTANKDTNSDLFWALRGGGGGTFGVVTSVVVKVHPDVQITSASWTISGGLNNSITKETFGVGLRAYVQQFPRGADNQIYAYFSVFNIGGALSFTMAPFFAPNKSLTEAQAVLQPWLDEMTTLGIDVNPKWQHFSGFYEAYNASFPVEAVNNEGTVTASRMFPRRNWANETVFNATWDALWSNVEDGMALIAYSIHPSWAVGGHQNTSVNPAWREGIGYIITGFVHNMSQPASERLEQRLNFTNGPMQRWRDVTPGSGGYLNEGDRLEPNFQWAFWGSFYPQLLALKKRFDPFNLFWAATAVGSEFFEVRSIDGYPNENGRLCVKEEPSLYHAEGPVWVPH